MSTYHWPQISQQAERTRQLFYNSLQEPCKECKPLSGQGFKPAHFLKFAGKTVLLTCGPHTAFWSDAWNQKSSGPFSRLGCCSAWYLQEYLLDMVGFGSSSICSCQSIDLSSPSIPRYCYYCSANESTWFALEVLEWLSWRGTSITETCTWFTTAIAEHKSPN